MSACMVRYILCGICCALLTPTVSLAQNERYSTANYSVQNGLSSDYSDCLFQDSKGFIWIGTLDGLNRFDGYEFQHYLHPSDNDSSMRRNSVNAISEDADGNLWVGTFGGLDRRDRRRGTVVHFTHESKKPGSISSNYITSLSLDSEGQLWIGTNGGGVNILDTREANRKIDLGEIHTIEFRVLRNMPGTPQSLGNDGVIQVKRDRQGLVWICTHSGIDTFDPAWNVWKHYMLTVSKTQKTTYREVSTYPADFIPPRVPGDKFSIDKADIFQDEKGNVFIAHGGLHYYDRGTGKITPVRNMYVQRVIPYDTLNLLLVTADKLYLLSRATRSDLRPLFPEKDVARGVILDCMKDRAGAIWIGTDYGLIRRDDSAPHFKLIKTASSATDKELNVTGLAEYKDGGILVGTLNRGIVLLKQGDTCLHLPALNTQRTPVLQNERTCYALQKLSGQGYAVGSEAGLYLYSRDLKSKQRIGYGITPSYPEWGRVFSFLEDSHGNIWFASGDGRRAFLARLDVKSGAIDTMGFLQRRMQKLCKGYIWTMLEDSRQRLWLGMTNGVCCYDPADSSLQHFILRPEDQHSLSSDRVRSILEDRHGTIYFYCVIKIFRILRHREHSRSSDATPIDTRRTI